MRRLIVLFLCLACFAGLASPVVAQKNDPLPSDPLLQHFREVLRACFEKGITGLRPYLKEVKDEPANSPRLKAVEEFADGSHRVFEAWQRTNGNSRLRAFMNPDDLKMARPLGIDGKPGNDVLLRHDIPAEVKMTSPEGKLIFRIVWTFTFVKEGEKYLLESISKTFVTDPGHLAGEFFIKTETDACVVSFSDSL